MKFLIILLVVALKARESINLLTFTSGTTNGYVVALSLPLGRPESNVYMSHNLEANYALVTNSTFFTQAFYDKILFIDGVNKTAEAAARMQSLSLFSRRQVYRLIEGNLDGYGISGNQCLLRLICEAAKSDLISSNGFIGSLIHILLTPSMSSIEAEMSEYVDAEKAGEKGEEECAEYRKNCSVKIIDLFSRYL
jgi:hypothetical protein